MKSFYKAASIIASSAVLLGAAHGETTLEKIQRTGHASMGVRDSSLPLAYTLGNGQYDGYHIEICRNIIKAAQAKLKLANIAIDYTPVTSQNRIPLVVNGTVDLECGSTTNNEARQKEVDFGYTTFITEVRMAVRADSNINSIAQLNGKTVVTTTGTTSVQLLRKNEKSKGIDFKEILGKDHAESFLLMERGRADAFVMDNNLLAGNIANSKTPKDFKITGEVLSVEPIAVMFRKGDPAFAEVVNNTIADLMKSGEITKIYNKWFTSPIPPKNINVNLPMSDNLKKAIASPNNKPTEGYPENK